MGAGTVSVDSNITGLTIAEEVLGSPKTLPATPVWYPVEPNSYAEFGGQTKTVKREPINASRQKRKGAVVGFDVVGGIQVDFTTKAAYPLMKGFMFADWREKTNLLPSAVTASGYTVAAGGTGFQVGSIVFGEGFSLAANNGLDIVTATTATSVSVAGAAAEASPPLGALITNVGFQCASADAAMTSSGGRAVLTTTTLDFTTLGLIPGEWVWLGGDSAATQFATAAANGFYRIYSVVAHALTFDHWPGNNPAGADYSVATDAGTGKTLQIFYGHVIKNEATPALQKFRTYQMERTLGTGKYQYLLGCGANTFKATVKTGDKVTADLSYVAMDEDDTQVAAKAGTRPALQPEVAFTGASSFSRVRLIGQDGVTPLVSALTDLTLSIDNGINGLEAIVSNFGKVDLSSGDFTVSGSLTAYFSTLSAVAAVKANVDASIDFVMVENVSGFATGWLFDMPYVMLGDGRLKVEKDKPITLPLNLDAAGHPTLNHTLLAMRFAYLPQAAT